MYAIFTYISLKFVINVGKYSIRGAFGQDKHFSNTPRKMPRERTLVINTNPLPTGSMYGIFAYMNG